MALVVAKTHNLLAEAGTASDRRVRLAIQLADAYGAQLKGLGAEGFGPMMSTGFATADGAMIEVIQDRIAADLPAAETRFRELTKGCGRASWMAERDYPDKMLALHARGADLIVASRPRHGEDAAYAAKPADLIVRAGAPGVLAAEGDAIFSGERVVVAWKDARESRRAVSDALPFLQRAKVVTIVAISGEANGWDARAGLTEVADRLAQHGIAATVEIHPKGKETVTTVLEDVAARRGADLIVAGAYGRSHLQEWVLGGVTEDLIAWSSKFVLLSH